MMKKRANLKTPVKNYFFKLRRNLISADEEREKQKHSVVVITASNYTRIYLISRENLRKFGKRC